MTEVSVLIPWRSDGAHRERSFDWARRRWETLLPGAELVVCDDPNEPFSRGHARNLAFEQSSGEVVVVADADTTVGSAATLAKAIEMAAAGEWVLPYETYFNATEEHTQELLRLAPGDELHEPVTWEFRLTDSISGALVMPREAFRTVGGYDERFIGWGYEDRAFAIALDTLWKPCVRLPGHVLHLWHPVGPSEAFGSPFIQQNQALHIRYQRAAGNRAALLALRPLP